MLSRAFAIRRRPGPRGIRRIETLTIRTTAFPAGQVLAHFICFERGISNLAFREARHIRCIRSCHDDVLDRRATLLPISIADLARESLCARQAHLPETAVKRLPPAPRWPCRSAIRSLSWSSRGLVPSSGRLGSCRDGARSHLFTRIASWNVFKDGGASGTECSATFGMRLLCVFAP